MKGLAATAPVMTHVFTLEVELLSPVVVSDTSSGQRLFIPIVGGTANGPRLTGRVLPGGGDWAVERASGEMDIHAHYLIQTDDGVVIEVDNRGHWRERPDDMPYFVTAPVFSTHDSRYRWLSRGVFVGMAHEVDGTQIVIDVYIACLAGQPPAVA